MGVGFLKIFCGRRESNPRIKLGKLAGYHYITPADLGKLSGPRHENTNVFQAQMTAPSGTTAPLGMITMPSRT